MGDSTVVGSEATGGGEYSYSAEIFAESEHESGEEDYLTDFGIGTLVLALTLGAASRVYLTKVTRLPYTVILLLLGASFGLILHHEVFDGMGVFGESLNRWAGVDSQVILFVFLPVLIFESALVTDVHTFQREFWQVLALAGPGVAIATIMTASVFKYIFPYEWDWNLSLMLGGILSATDPVAVVALLKELGVSERLNVLIEGESALNDATGIVVFVVFRDAFVGVAESTPLQVLKTAARIMFGGPLVGLAVGMFGSFLLGYIIDDAMTEITVTVIVCFSSFIISEATKLRVSGVLATVTAGLVMSFYAGGRISPGVEHAMHTFWSMVTYVANTVIFFLSGLIIGNKAISGSALGGQEWGMLAVLFVMLQLIRAAVVLALLPVLTKWGTGMTYKQLMVLTFAGLRGAVGLTLALIVVEDDRIEPDVQELVLFYVAGIAALTLVINGSLAGLFVSYLGLDRSTTAETEVFTKACGAIEARLEHKLDLLKGDRFLGDADWDMVWRYMPVSTSKMYWHRIRHGNVNLSAEEEEDIQIIRERMIYKAGLQGNIGFRAYQLRKWVTRKVLRLREGGRGVSYNELPSRLQYTWYTYHKRFHHSPSTGARDDKQQCKDMQLHRLNSQPRMMLEAEAWSNLNAGDGMDPMMHTSQTPVSHTLRKYLDNVGMLRFQEESGMTSDFGKGQIVKHAAGGKSGTLFYRGRGGPEALRMVEGISKLKEERRRARQAVAQAEARLDRLKKDMTISRHKGLEEDMKDNMLGHASIHGGACFTNRTGTLRERNASRRPSHGDGRGVGDLDDEKQPDTNNYNGTDGGDSDDDDDDDDDQVGMPMDSFMRGSGRFKDDGEWGSNGGRDGGRGGEEGEGEQYGGGDRHEVKAKVEVAPEWNPHEDSFEEDGKNNPRLAMGHLRKGSQAESVPDSTAKGEGRSSSAFTSETLLMGSMSEARVRFLTAVKAHFTARYHQGWLSSTGLRVLKENMDTQLDHDELEMNQWSRLSRGFRLPTKSAFLRKIPFVGTLVESYMYRRLTFIFELASNFISAHEDVDILELLHEGPVTYQLALEKNKQLQEARTTLAQQLPVFPELARSLKTRVAARYMLVQHREVVHELSHHGHINERESERLIAENNAARVKLEYHPAADNLPDRVTLLKNAPFLRFLTDEEKAEIINNEKACQEEFYGSNVVLMSERMTFTRGSRRQGWFSVVRGAVHQNTQGEVGHTSSGGTLRLRKLAKERLVNAGTVIGLDEQLLQAPYRCTYTTASFVHLFFFDKTQMLLLAEQYPGLKRGLWWLLAVSVVRHHHGFRGMNLACVYQLMKMAVFKEFRTPGLSLNSSHHAGIRPQKTPGGLNLSRHKVGRQEPLNSSRHGDGGVDNRPAIVRAALSLNESRHKLTQGLRRTVSRGHLNNGSESEAGQPPSLDSKWHGTVIEEGSNVLLLRGTLRERLGSLGTAEPSLSSSPRERKAVTIIRDVSGNVEFMEGSVAFIMPAVLMARASSGHQMLMREIEQRHCEVQDAAADGQSPAKLESGAASPGLRLHKSTSLSESGAVEATLSPSSPLRVREYSFPGGRSHKNAAATDAMTMAVADEANPRAHPDTLRRERTLRDAALAAKAGSRKVVESGSSGAADRSSSVGSDGKEELEAPWIGRRAIDVRGQADRSAAPLSIGSRRNAGSLSFVEMRNVPVTATNDDDTDSGRGNRDAPVENG